MNKCLKLPLKKNVLIVITAIILFISVITIFLLSSNAGVNNEQKLETLKAELNLDAIVNLGRFSKNNYNEKNLLDVAMLIATQKGLLQEYRDENTYFEYISKPDLHSLILELTGMEIEAPIEIPDFYYLYDSENKYYYCRPSSPSYYEVDEITSLKENKDGYEIVCSIIRNIDSDIKKIDNVSIFLSLNQDNAHIKYMIEKIEY